MNPTTSIAETSAATTASTAALAGKSYLITGGSTGIGFATAAVLVRDGAQAFITGRTRSTLDAAVAQLGPRAVALPVDVADPEALKDMARRIGERVDRLDGVFVNAGGATFSPVDSTTPAEFDALFASNVRGAYFTVQVCLPLLRAGGTIVFNSSIVSRVAVPGAAAYTGTKGAVTSMARTLAVELAPRGIRVNTLSPGPVETPAIDKAGVDAADRASFAQATLMKRWGRPEEVAQLARFLLTDESSFVAGEDIAVDGGFQLS